MTGDLPKYPEENDRDLEAKYKVTMNEAFDSFLCIDGIPIAPKEKLEKLTSVLTTAFNKNIGRVKEDGIYIPTDESGSSKGFMFVEFEDPDEAVRAQKAANDYRLDKKHTFKAFFFDDISRFANAQEGWAPPEKTPFVARENLRTWLEDPAGRDQFAILKGLDSKQMGNMLSIYWFAKSENPAPVYQRKDWAESQFQWSPKGSYLSTFHSKGIALWGSSKWNKLARLAHNNVRLIDFSPNENYLTTWSQVPINPDDDKNIVVWDVRSGTSLRQFRSLPEFEGSWPSFKWSHDDRYLARIGPDLISIYQTPDMGLLDKKSIQVPMVRDLSWSPSQNIIAFWTPESGNDPARVTLMEIPSREIIRTKNLFNIQDCKFHWQSDGEYLLVKVTKTKTKKNGSISLELFRLREKGVPVETFDLKEENPNLINWEPKGQKFSVVDSDAGIVSFYVIDKTIKLLKRLDKKTVNRVDWSPQGQFVVLSWLGAPHNGTLEFWNVKNADQVESMASFDHYLCTDIEWDPSGQYVSSSVSGWKVSADTGFNIYDFKGKMLREEKVDKFFQLLWRPRPPSLLSKDKKKTIKKNLAKYSAEFNRLDEAMDSSAASAYREGRRKQVAEWKAFMEMVQNQYKNQKKLRESISGYASDDDEGQVTVDDLVEELVDETKTLVK